MSHIQRRHGVSGLIAPSGVWSTICSANPGRLIFVSGLLAQDEHGAVVGQGDAFAQTVQVIENLEKALQAAGAELSNVVRVDVFVLDITQFAEIHRARKVFFADHAPASTMVEVKAFIDPACLIEMNAIAALPPP